MRSVSSHPVYRALLLHRLVSRIHGPLLSFPLLPFHPTHLVSIPLSSLQSLQASADKSTVQVEKRKHPPLRPYLHASRNLKPCLQKNAKSVDGGGALPNGYSYTITSPQSTIFGFHLLGLTSPSMELGTVTSSGLYRYHPFSAAAAALNRASFNELPTPSPSLSLPEYTPTTNTGCLLSRPVSEMRRATGASKPSRAQRRDRSRVGVRKSKRVLRSRCLLVKWSRKKRCTIGRPRWRCRLPIKARTNDCAASSRGTGFRAKAWGLRSREKEPNSSLLRILCVVVMFQFLTMFGLNAAGRSSPDRRRRNWRRPGSTSPPGSAAASMPHSLAIVARAFGPMYAYCAAKTTGMGSLG
jgi:hypothetical protein